MDQLKIGIAMLVVAGIIVWIGAAYALDAWRAYRFRAAARRQADSRSATSPGDEQSLPPAEAA